MKDMFPKDFIKKVLIKEVGELVESKPYIAFALMAIGIEFLGKCLDVKQQDWNKGSSKKNFNKAIDTLDAFKKYKAIRRKEGTVLPHLS